MQHVRTKIVCTIGPASNNKATVRDMINHGMNVARLNFSHGDHASHKKTINMLKELREEMNVPLAILMDTRGPEIRLGMFEGDGAVLKEGSTFTLTTRQVMGNAGIASVSYEDFPSRLNPGVTVLLDDGKLSLLVDKVEDTEIHCNVISGGKIGNRKGINVPRVQLGLPYISEQDKNDLIFGVENDVDFIAASFVRSEEDIIALRKLVDYHGGHDILIISKIENLEGIDNFDAILTRSDGIMVARGDMGVEVEYEKLPGLQKRFIKKCYQSGKMVITATQMLESMITNPTPTRAEITDVANAVFDGTSAVMLSGETAMGKHPVQAVDVMARIANQAEADVFDMEVYKKKGYLTDTSDTPGAVCDAACTTARDISAKAIIALTKYGSTARKVSKFRPAQPIVAATPLVKTYHQLSLSWGVYPAISKHQKSFDDLFTHSIDCARQINVVDNGDYVVVVGGVPIDTAGSTNLLKVEIVGQRR